MKTAIVFLGIRENNTDWPHYAWNVSINGIDFEYHTGLGHATPKFKRGEMGTVRKPAGIQCISTNDAWVHVPEIDQILECLFSDSDAGNYSFNEFCDNLGYSNDSLKALDTYRACMASGEKLRKALGAAYQTEKTRIEAARGN